jgi:hypothetical protein
MWENAICFMCDDPVEIVARNPFGPIKYTFRCCRCGDYGVSSHFATAPDVPSDLKPRISAATRQAHELGTLFY